MNKCDEADVILYYRSRITNLCRNKWPCMPIDEKIAEAEYFMLCAIRTPSFGNGSFWNEYLNSFIPYMDKYYRNENKHRYGCLSLDADLRTKRQDTGWTLLECLPSDVSLENAVLLKEFLDSLPKQSKSILLELVAKRPRTDIMRRYGLKPNELRKICLQLQDKYSMWRESMV